jgi:hypothetical protein
MAGTGPRRANVRRVAAGSRAAWTPAELRSDTSWIVELDDRSRRDLVAAVRRATDPHKSLFDYQRADFDLGCAYEPVARAFREAQHGRGMAVLRGLPRTELSEADFALLTWGLGLHFGVARPQGKTSQYLSAVRDAGVDYRSAGGRGYSSNAELDFHIDGVDVVVLTCFNKARSGGMSLVASSITAHNVLVDEQPDVAEILYEPFHFSRQAEEAPDETPTYPSPVFDVLDGSFFGKWNRNRILSAQRIDGVPPLSDRQREAMEAIDDVLRRPDVLHKMFLEPGDAQILSSFTTLHSRTTFDDNDAPEQRRLLYRLWLTPPDAPPIPASWQPLFRSSAARTVRGGIIGHHYDEACRAFDARQAADHGMLVPAD